MSYLAIVRAQLKVDEAVKSKPYRDIVGKLTIACGRNLDDVGLRPDEIDLMLDNDIAAAERVCRDLFPDFDSLSDQRKAVLLNMAFNLGPGLSAFHKMVDAVNHDDFEEAAKQMESSKWAGQVGARAERLAKHMREG